MNRTMCKIQSSENNNKHFKMNNKVNNDYDLEF